MQASSRDLAPYLDQLRALPFVKAVAVERGVKRDDRNIDAVITLQTPTGKVRYFIEVKPAQLNRTLAADLMSRHPDRASNKVLLFSQYVPPGIAEELAQHGIQFIDAAGNQNIQIADRYIVRTSGKRAARGLPSEHKSTQPTGYLVYFALLADPALRSAPVRTVAAAVGVSKSAVSNAIAKLEAQNVMVRRRATANWIDTRALLERWLVGYADTVRPRLFFGAYRTQASDPPTLEKHLEAHMPPDATWAWGGGAAAYRLTGHYRGETTLVHVAAPTAELVRKLRAVPVKQDPSLVILRAPGPLILQGALPHTAHPLLVYSELLCGGDERAREAAAEVRETRLGPVLA